MGHFRGSAQTGLGGAPGSFAALTATGLFTEAAEDSITAFATGGKASATPFSATKNLHRISICATAADSVLMPAALAGQAHYVRNDGVAASQVFGAGTDTINGVATGTGVSIAVAQGAWFVCTTAGNWTTTPLVSTSAAMSDQVVTVNTGNGYGSTNTKIRRFTNIQTNTGTAITYADSATNGGTFTINEAGMYEVYYQDPSSSGAQGISLNSNQLTTAINGISIATRMGFSLGVGAGSQIPVTRVLRLAVNDVIRAHTDGTAVGVADTTFFSIRKIAL